jgi:formyltetrahydrofolate hydrolase
VKKTVTHPQLPQTTATLLMRCPDRKGLVYRIAEFLVRVQMNLDHGRS